MRIIRTFIFFVYFFAVVTLDFQQRPPYNDIILF